jgi:undecaprenyl diphosphate synthase
MAENIPNHIAIIPDGNRRWARSKGLPTLEGHRRGVEVFERIGDAALSRGVKYMTFYAFSTENWTRSKREVQYLVKLLHWVLTNKVKSLHERNVKVNIIGRVEALSADLRKHITNAMSLTEKNTRGVLNLAINYGGRPELVDVVRSIVANRYNAKDVTEDLIRRELYTGDIPDPDLIIRTSGEQRLSNFLTWQSAYSELYFVQKHWPAFNERDLDAALAEYARRERRFGS